MDKNEINIVLFCLDPLIVVQQMITLNIIMSNKCNEGKHNRSRAFCQFLGAFSKSRTATVSFFMYVCLSVRPHGTAGFPLHGFLLNFTFQLFSKTCLANSVFIKT